MPTTSKLVNLTSFFRCWKCVWSYLSNILQKILFISEIAGIIFSFIFCKKSVLQSFYCNKPGKRSLLYNIFQILRNILSVLKILFCKNINYNKCSHVARLIDGLNLNWKNVFRFLHTLLLDYSSLFMMFRDCSSAFGSSKQVIYKRVIFHSLYVYLHVNSR